MKDISERNFYFDFLRGFAIVMVVGIHSMTNTHPDFGAVEGFCTILLRLTLNCAVPLFLAISGYFIASKKISTKEEHLAFLKRQIPKVYVPCLIFSLPYLALSIYTRENNLLTSLSYYFLCGFSVYYFIALIVQYYLLIPILTRINKWGGVIFCAVISILSIIFVTYLQKVEGYSLPLLIYAGPFPLWILFFFMGIYFASSDRNYSLTWPILLTVFGFCFQVVEYIYWFDKGQNALGIKLSSFIFSAGIIWLLFSRKIENRYIDNLFFNAMSWIGGISFGIYLLHCYIIIAVSRLLPSINWIENWTIVLSLTILVIWCVKSIIPNFSKKYLGFR